jgi:hypothetical protein
VPRLVSAALAAVILAAATAVPPAAASTGGVRYEPPVDGPVVDPFRPPAARWAPGNRGLEYATTPGSPVGAAADGVVVFAGSVGGSLHVTIEHADAVRTSYSFLVSVGVRRGERVRLGQPIGSSADRFHLGARIDGEYIDPALLFARRLRLHVRLVPHDDPERDRRYARMQEASERELLAVLVATEGPGLLDRLGGAVGAALDAGGEPLRLVVHHTVTARIDRLVLGADLAALALVDQGPCTAGSVSVAPPSERRRAVLVGGLNSSTATASVTELPLASHGYAQGDIVRFSYRGGVVDDPGLAGTWAEGLPVSDYDPDDTRGDLRGSGRLLADLLAEVVAAEPGVPVDVYAHSMGGLVARVAVAELTARGLRAPDLVVTLGSPHRGADLATAGTALRYGPSGPSAGGFLDVADSLGDAVPVVERVADLDPRDPAVRQLSEVSDFIGGLPPLPAGTRALSIGARTDLVVPSTRLGGAGARVVVVDGDGVLGAHDRLPASAAANREIALVLAGLAPSCRGRLDRVVDRFVGEAVSDAEDALGLLVLASGPVRPAG